MLIKSVIGKVTKSITIIGPMGAGKTTVGLGLTRALGFDFIDMDKEIEKSTGAEISWIFEKEGETGFRKREKKLLNDLSRKVNIVVSTGGGIISDKENRETLKNFSTVFFLMCEPQTSLKRTKNDQNRPLLLNTNRLEKLKELYEKRKSAYSYTAHYTIDVNKMSSKAAINKILTVLKNGQS